MQIAIAATPESIHKYKSLPKSATTVPFKHGIPKELDSRCTTNLVLIKYALELGGIDPDFNFIEIPNYRREKDEVAKGNALLGAHMVSASAIKFPSYRARLFQTQIVINPGQNELGIYCLPQNVKVLAARNAKDLNSAGPALIGLHWIDELNRLHELGITNIEKGSDEACLFKMINANRANWIPMGFCNSKDLGITRSGIKLVPVPGIKISLPESFHYIVSKRHPHGETVFKAMNKGLDKMKKQGVIRKILANGGFSCTATKNWKDLRH